jgi:ADP-L-glycero-D-manno-heptose 6-epimerase
MKILITGHRGFIGRHMAEALQEHELSFFEWGAPLPDFKGLDWCIHLGAITSTTETDVEKVLEQNYDFSRIVINECNANGVNLQFASSASVYGLESDFSEDSPVSPKSPYAWSKYLFERYVAGFQNRWSIKVQGFRYFNVYGQYEDKKGDQASPYYKFEKQAKETGVIKLFHGSEFYFRDFVPVSRVIEVHKAFFNINKSGIWNLGTGSVKSFKEIAEEIAAKHNASIEYIDMPASIAQQYQKYTCADLTNLNKALEDESSSQRNI